MNEEILKITEKKIKRLTEESEVLLLISERLKLEILDLEILIGRNK